MSKLPTPINPTERIGWGWEDPGVAKNAFIDGYIRGRKEANNKIEELQEIMRKGCKMVEDCGHLPSCRCCWCKLRILMKEQSDDCRM